MPFPNFHRCRLRDPGDFEDGSFVTSKREHDGKAYNVTQGRLRNENTLTDHAFLYHKDVWSVDQARAHCTDHDGILFKPAGSDEREAAAEYERRFNLACELRVSDDTEFPITGYASVFNTFSEEIFGFREIVDPGTFKRSLKRDDVRALFNHDPNIVLGRNKAKTLTLAEDDHGLKIGINPPDTQMANDLQTSMRRGDLTQMSIGFNVIKQVWEETDGELLTRRIKEAKLWDVSIVTFPAFTDTSVAVRAMKFWRDDRNAEHDAAVRTELDHRRRRLALAENELI